MVSATSARPRGAREVVPAKMTSSILPPRSDFAPCSPITQESASTTLDLPEPFGPTTQVIPGSRRSVVADANDLKPRRVRDFRYTCPLLPRNDPAERPSLEGYRPGRATAGKRAATVRPGVRAGRPRWAGGTSRRRRCRRALWWPSERVEATVRRCHPGRRVWTVIPLGLAPRDRAGRP